MTTMTAGARLQPELAEFADRRRFAGPVTPYKRGFEDCYYSRVYANVYAPGTVAAQSYDAGVQDAHLARAQMGAVFCPQDTQALDAALTRRGLTATVERVSLATGAVTQRFTIGKAEACNGGR